MKPSLFAARARLALAAGQLAAIAPLMLAPAYACSAAPAVPHALSVSRSLEDAAYHNAWAEHDPNTEVHVPFVYSDVARMRHSPQGRTGIR
jgi:hypothetical protein